MCCVVNFLSVVLFASFSSQSRFHASLSHNNITTSIFTRGKGICFFIYNKKKT